MWSGTGTLMANMSVSRGSTATAASDIMIDHRNSLGLGVDNIPSALFLTAGNDSLLKMWDLKRMKQVDQIHLTATNTVTKLCWCGENGQIVTGNTNGSVRLLTPRRLTGMVPGKKSIDMDVIESKRNTYRWFGTELTTYSQASCSDIICNDTKIISASKSGHIYCWNRM
jgi:WD40 repeat protein